MAQTIYCNTEGCEKPASTITTNIETGDTVAYCPEHFVEFVVGVANAVMEQYQKAHPNPDQGSDGVAQGKGEGTPRRQGGRRRDTVAPDHMPTAHREGPEKPQDDSQPATGPQ